MKDSREGMENPKPITYLRGLFTKPPTYIPKCKTLNPSLTIFFPIRGGFSDKGFAL